MGYSLHFIVYTAAMLGIIFLAMHTYKAVYGVKKGLNTSILSVTDSMKLTPKKTLYVVKAGGERFLIASDFDSTTLISKLDDNEIPLVSEVPNTKREDKSVKLASFDGIKSMKDFVSKSTTSTKKPVMKELARKLQCL